MVLSVNSVIGEGGVVVSVLYPGRVTEAIRPPRLLKVTFKFLSPRVMVSGLASVSIN